MLHCLLHWVSHVLLSRLDPPISGFPVGQIQSSYVGSKHSTLLNNIVLYLGVGYTLFGLILVS